MTEKNQTEEMWVAILLLVFTTNLNHMQTRQSMFLVLLLTPNLEQIGKMECAGSMDYIDVNKKNISLIKKI